MIELEPRYLLQMAHLTTPATVWKYIEKAVTRSKANLVMLDLEDSIPRGNLELLQQGRSNVIRAFKELDWDKRLRFFRPRGYELDPEFEDVRVIIEAAGDCLDGLIYPKVEVPEELRALDAAVEKAERSAGLAPGKIKIEVLIESVNAVERVFEIARASERLVGLVLGSYDYWASLGMRGSVYRCDHPLINYARVRLVSAAASVGVPAIAEMTTNYPTQNKTEQERVEAIEEFRRDATLARDFGFAGKWTGMPEQSELAVELFSIPDAEIAQAIEEVKQFLEIERGGLGSTIIDGRMADRATDRVHRNTLKIAYALGKLDESLARRLELD
ncbi:MAG: hypothetical protein DMF61_02785 [Blastocatellia bacterium AA13]|nr:MAG: hypothetical protein DMF61_02785 [Blastocatellia bacterium AA13]